MDLCDIDRAPLSHRMRISEALKLTVADVTHDGGPLAGIRATPMP
jgi:hypothetical protein